MGVVVKVDSDIYAGNPTKHGSRSGYKGDARPPTGDAYQLRVLVEPEGAGVCRETQKMENDTVPVLGMSEKTPPARGPCGPRSAQISLNAAATAMTVIARLTQGPHSIAPTMTVMAKIGKNDLPNSCAAFEKRTCDRRPTWHSFPLML
jgi:hypothetical protein